jgi:hypothetical protein
MTLTRKRLSGVTQCRHHRIGGRRALPHGARRPRCSGRPSYGVPMTTMYAALLRGIQVCGHHRIPMAELRTLLTELGHGGRRALIKGCTATARNRNSVAKLVEMTRV